jgi:hypothetical protein
MRKENNSFISASSGMCLDAMCESWVRQEEFLDKAA